RFLLCLMALLGLQASGIAAQELTPQTAKRPRPTLSPMAARVQSFLQTARRDAAFVRPKGANKRRPLLDPSCLQPCWGPGIPTMYSRYFVTQADWMSANAVPIGANTVVPRTSYAFGTAAMFGMDSTDTADLWQIAYHDPSGVVFWVEVMHDNNGNFVVTTS